MMNESRDDSPEDDKTRTPPTKRTIREVDSSELLHGESELLIRHGDEVYRLKLTRNGKLILQK